MTLASTALIAAVPLNPNWSTKTTQATAEIRKMITFADAGADLGHISHSFKQKYWKLKRLTTKAHFPFCNFGRAPTAQARVISIIPQSQQFVNRQFAQKINNAFS